MRRKFRVDLFPPEAGVPYCTAHHDNTEYCIHMDSESAKAMADGKLGVKEWHVKNYSGYVLMWTKEEYEHARDT